MNEIRLESFQGIRKLSARRELENAKSNNLRRAVNVTIGNDGGLYVCTGSVNKTRLGSIQFRYVHYSEALDLILGFSLDGNLYLYKSTGTNYEWALQTTHAGVTLGISTRLGPSFADWGIATAITSPNATGPFCFFGGGNGANLNILHTNGTVLSQYSANYYHCIATHKNNLFGAYGNYVYPSDPLAPKTVDTSWALSCPDDGPFVTALCSLNGALYVHKYGTIYAVYGDTYTTEFSDVSLINLKTGVGAIRPSAVWVFAGKMWFIGNNGFYMFDGDKLTKLDSGLMLPILRSEASPSDNHCTGISAGPVSTGGNASISSCTDVSSTLVDASE